ncbi:MAG TPA: PQQ-dependent sugar dehydrogenase [Solirubrobacteraceae bacterium]
MRPPLLVLLLATGALAATAGQAAAFDLEQVPGTYDQPVYAIGPPGDPTQLFVVEKKGRIKLVDDGAAVDEPFLDISGQVDIDGEEGLLSMAFAPDYNGPGSQGRYWIVYTADAPENDKGDLPGSEIVVEERLRDDPGRAAEIIRIPHHNFSNHNGGQLQLGPDGHLWLSTGDGGGANDQLGNAQNPRSLLGKLLRFTPIAGGGHAIPADNPYADGVDGAPEVWAIGLRNPWRFSFDRETGDLLIGDVGQGAAEEIDFAAAPDRGRGDNYGWPAYEGNRVTGLAPPPADHHPPLIEHLRDDGWKAIAGGYVIRDPELCEFGRYVYGDSFRPGGLFLADPLTGATTEIADRQVSFLVSFGEDAAAHVYAVSLNGPVYRLTGDAATQCPPPPEEDDDEDTTTTTPAPAPPTQDPPAPPPFQAPRPPGALGLYVDTAPRQRGVKLKRVFVKAGCNARCRITLTGGLWVGPRRFTLIPTSIPLRGDTPFTFYAQLGPRARRAARRALRRGGHPTARLTVTATGDAPRERRFLSVAVIG